MTDDFYDLLGIDEDASQEEIKDAFRTQVREYHPDLNDDPRAPAQFTALKKAYDTLGTPDERNAYDRMGHEDYVAKRLQGLPSRDAWATDDDSGSTTSGSTESTSASGAGTASKSRSRSTGTSSSRSAGSSGGTSSSRRSSSHSSSSASDTASSSGGSAGTTSSSRTANASTTSSTSGAAGASAGGGGAATGTHSRSGTATGGRSTTTDSGVLSRIANVRIGLRGIFLAGLVYLAGLAGFVYGDLAGVRAAATGVASAGTDPNAVWMALQARGGIQTVPAYLLGATALEGVGALGIAMAAGVALLPLTVGVVIYRTRKHSSWRISSLYVVATVAPLVGLAVNYGAGITRLYVDLLCYALLPVGAYLLLPVHVFVHRRL